MEQNNAQQPENTTTNHATDPMSITDIVRGITQAEINHTTTWRFIHPVTILQITVAVGPDNTDINIRVFLWFLEVHYSKILDADIVDREDAFQVVGTLVWWCISYIIPDFILIFFAVWFIIKFNKWILVPS